MQRIRRPQRPVWAARHSRVYGQRDVLWLRRRTYRRLCQQLHRPRQRCGIKPTPLPTPLPIPLPAMSWPCVDLLASFVVGIRAVQPRSQIRTVACFVRFVPCRTTYYYSCFPQGGPTLTACHVQSTGSFQMSVVTTIRTLSTPRHSAALAAAAITAMSRIARILPRAIPTVMATLVGSACPPLLSFACAHVAMATWPCSMMSGIPISANGPVRLAVATVLMTLTLTPCCRHLILFSVVIMMTNRMVL